MIKKILKLQLIGVLFFLTSVAANTQNNCDNLKGCEKKICHIKRDLAIAKQSGNESREKGLQISLDKVNAHCTDEKLIKDLEEKIKDTKKDLHEDEEDYEKALKDNRPDKVEKYKTKISEENQKIKRLEDELKTLL
ncbi:MAG: DUF1090 family protein [Sulfurovum sp.]|nr:DUF1090 family protein [Sulfurovum sp.]